MPVPKHPSGTPRVNGILNLNFKQEREWVSKNVFLKISRINSGQKSPYPVCQHDSCSCCSRFGSLDANVTKGHVAMVIDNSSGDLKKSVRTFVSVAKRPSRVGTEARFVRIDGDGIAVVES